jgi:hypothetical protein
MRFKLLDALFVESVSGLLREGVETKKDGERKSKKGAAWNFHKTKPARLLVRRRL